MSKNLVLAIGGGVVSAFFALTVLVVSPILMFLVALALGIRQGLVAGAAALATAFLIGGVPGMLFCGLVVVLPTLVLARQALLARPGTDGALEWYPPGLLAAALTGLGAMLVAATTAFTAYADPNGPDAWVRHSLEEAIRRLGLVAGDAQIAAVTDLLAPTAPGIAIAIWLVLLVINGSTAQTLLVRGNRNLRPAMDLAMFRLPGWVPIAAVGAGLLALLGDGVAGFVGRNLTVVAMVPFFLTGLAVVHVVSRPWPYRAILLLVFYALLFVLGWPTSLLLILLGVIEQWLDLRGRIAGGGAGTTGRGPGKV